MGPHRQCGRLERKPSLPPFNREENQGLILSLEPLQVTTPLGFCYPQLLRGGCCSLGSNTVVPENSQESSSKSWPGLLTANQKPSLFPTHQRRKSGGYWFNQASHFTDKQKLERLGGGPILTTRAEPCQSEALTLPSPSCRSHHGRSLLTFCFLL